MSPRPIRPARASHGVLCAAALLITAACGDPTAPLPTDAPPSELTFSTYSGWDLGGVTVRLVGDTVVTSRGSGPGAVVTRRVPTGAEWGAFWRAVASAGVTRWPAECRNLNVADAGTLTYALAWSGARREGTYYASYPTATGACSDAAGAWADALVFQNAVYAVAGLPAT